jgi:hypothetical protein
MELEMERLKVEKEKLENERLQLRLDRVREEESHRENMRNESDIQKRIQEETLMKIARMNAMNRVYHQHHEDVRANADNLNSKGETQRDNSGIKREMGRRDRQKQHELVTMFNTLQETDIKTRHKKQIRPNESKIMASTTKSSSLNSSVGGRIALGKNREDSDEKRQQQDLVFKLDVAEIDPTELVSLSTKMESKLKVLLKESLKDFVHRLDNFNSVCQNVLIGHLPEKMLSLNIEDPRRVEIASIRLFLQEGYEELLYNHIKLAQAKNVEKRVWMLIYKEIDEYQAYIRELKMAEEIWLQREDEKSLHLVRLEQGKQKQALQQGIADGLQFCGKILMNLWSSVENVNSDRQKLLIKTLQKLYIAMGDLHRYKAQHGPSSHKDDGLSLMGTTRAKATMFYKKAKFIDPYVGKAHNQLGVVSQQNGDLFLSAYHYCRAVSAVEPFPAQQNLLLLFEKCKSALNTKFPTTSKPASCVGWGSDVKREDYRTLNPNSSGRGRRRQDYEPDNRKKQQLSWEEVELRVIVLTGINYTQIDEGIFGKELEKLLWDLPKLLQQAVTRLQEFHSRFFLGGSVEILNNVNIVKQLNLKILRILILCIFNLYFNHSRRQKGENVHTEWANGSSMENAFSLFYNVMTILMQFVCLNACNCNNISSSKRNNTKGGEACCVTFEDFGRCGFGYPLSLALPAIDLGIFWLSAQSAEVSMHIPRNFVEQIIHFQNFLLRSIPQRYRDSSCNMNRNCKHTDSLDRLFSMIDARDEFCGEELVKKLTSTSRERFMKVMGLIDIRQNDSNTRQVLPIESDLEVEGFKPVEVAFQVELEEDANIVSQMERHFRMKELLALDLENSGVNWNVVERVVFSIRTLESIKQLPLDKLDLSNEVSHRKECIGMDHDEGNICLTQDEETSSIFHENEKYMTQQPESVSCLLSNTLAHADQNDYSSSDQSDVPPLLREDPQENRMDVETLSSNMSNEKDEIDDCALISTADNQAKVASDEDASVSRGFLNIGMSAMDGLMQEMSKKDLKRKEDEKQRQKQSVYHMKKSGGGGRSDLHFASSHGIQSHASSDLFPLIVIDASNVAMKHGMNKKFSCKGIELAIQFYKVRGHRVVCFMPEYYLSYENVAAKKAMLRVGRI